MSEEENEIPENINKQLNETLGVEDEDNLEYTPIYRVYGEAKIPVSKAEGKLWNTRKQQAAKVMEDVSEAWNIAYKYFNADQINIKDDGTFEIKTSTKLRKNNYNTENLVWANNIGLIPALYSQDPSIEVTNLRDKEQDKSKMATMIERLVNILFKKRDYPGVNIKNKARKGILNALLTNRGVLKIGWTFKIDGNDQALEELSRLGDQLENAKDVQEVKEIEGKIKATEEILNFASPSGCFVKHIRPTDLFIDPNANEQDGTDANWIMEREYIPTEYLRAKFGKYNKDKEEVESVYSAGKVLPVGNKELDFENENVILDTDKSYENFGYDNAENYKRSCLTECFWVWDKTKRRVYLYSNNCWDYPIWVWEDPYKLAEFFPYYILNFHESPNSTLCRGETSYYLDQQNSINMINSQLAKMREFGFNHYLFDTNSGVDIKDIQKWLNGERSIAGIKLPPNKTFDQVLFPATIPTDKNQTLYDKSDLLRVIDMITGTDATTRSGEYKTNTTNMAIQSYIAGKSMRLDDKRDAIEDWLGAVGWGLAQLCIMYMDKEQVDSLIGADNAVLWQNMEQLEIQQTYSVQCVGGSTVKPTSDAKKQQALQITQILGQFASASPYVVIIMLEVLQRAFDEVIVKEEDIEMIKNSILQQFQAQQMQQQQQALLQNAQANKANSEVDENTAKTAQIISQLNGQPEEENQELPTQLLNGENNNG